MSEPMDRQPNLSSDYVPRAVFYDAADTVEYVRRDVPCVYRRIDGFLTLALDMGTRELVGFRLKGFKNVFLKHVKPRLRLLDTDFIVLVSVIEHVVEAVGDELFDEQRRDAYRRAYELAWQDQVAVRKRELPLAA